MSDTVFRTQQAPPEKESVPIGKKSDQMAHVSEADIPYTSYENSHDHPFPVDYFNLGEYWNVDKGYTKEVIAIDEFLNSAITQKKISNSTKAMKEYMKDLELTVGIKGYDPLSTKMAKILDYIKTMSN